MTDTWSYHYDANGHLSSLAIDLPAVSTRSRTFTYVDNALGEVMTRQDVINYNPGTDGLASAFQPHTNGGYEDGRPREQYYYDSGLRIGDMGNDGVAQLDYAGAIARSAVYQDHVFHPNGNYATPFSDFGQSYDPISTDEQGGQQTGSVYVATGGESLSQLAQSKYGDASLWWMVAEATSPPPSFRPAA